MTDTNVEIFKGRGTDARAARLRHPSAGPGPGAIATADLEGQFRIATALSNATEAMPKGYRKQPGAVLLALAWGQSHGVDILTAIQNVSFIDGKAAVDATMQRALAKRAGYELTITVTADGVTVGISQGGRHLGEATYTAADAEVAGLTRKDNWKRNPEDMLVARATTRAVRRFAPDVLLGMLVADEVDDTPELVDLVDDAPAPEPEGEQLTLSQAVAKTKAEMASAESNTMADEPTPVAPEAGVGESDWWSTPDDMRDHLKANGVSNADAIREAQAIAKFVGVAQPAGTMAAIWGHPLPEFREAWLEWVRAQGEP